MAKASKKSKEPLKTKFNFKGGYGKSARWQWSVIKGSEYLETGEIIGGRYKAEAEAEAAKGRIEEHRRSGKKGKPKTPIKLGNFIP